MAFYPQVVNIQNAVVTQTGSAVTGGLGYYDPALQSTQYAFQVTASPFTNTNDNKFEIFIDSSFRTERETFTQDVSGSAVTSSFKSELDSGLFLENTFITESLSGSFAVYNTQITSSRGLNLLHKYMSGSLTQSLYLTASEGLYATGSSHFKGTFDITDAVTLGNTLSVAGNVTGSSNLRVAGTSKLVGNVEADGNLTVGGNLTVQGATTTISSSNTTFKDSIIGLGITGSETFNNVGDRGIIFGRGASASSTLPGLWWDGTQFNLAESATSPASSSFGSITSYSPVRIGTLTLGGTQVTSTAAELNLLDGGTSVGSSITLTDSDGFIVNDAGSSKLVPISDIKGYIKPSTYQSKTSNFTAAAGYHYSVTTTSGHVIATIPSASSNADSIIRFKIKGGSNSLILDASGADTIDSMVSLSITDISQSLSIMSDGSSNWEIF